MHKNDFLKNDFFKHSLEMHKNEKKFFIFLDIYSHFLKKKVFFSKYTMLTAIFAKNQLIFGPLLGHLFFKIYDVNSHFCSFFAHFFSNLPCNPHFNTQKMIKNHYFNAQFEKKSVLKKNIFF